MMKKPFGGGELINLLLSMFTVYMSGGKVSYLPYLL